MSTSLCSFRLVLLSFFRKFACVARHVVLAVLFHLLVLVNDCAVAQKESLTREM